MKKTWLAQLAIQTTQMLSHELITVLWYLGKVLNCGLPIPVTENMKTSTQRSTQ